MAEINLLDHEVWNRENGYWFGEYTFLNENGLVDYEASDNTTSGQFDYRNYYGFISLQIDGNQLKQRNIFIRPAIDLESKDLNSDGLISINELNKFGFESTFDYSIDLVNQIATPMQDGIVADLEPFNYTEGTEKTFTANQEASDNTGNLSGTYFGIPTSTIIIGDNTVIYTVGSGDSIIQNQLTTLPGNSTRIRTAQGFNFINGEPSYASFYRETKFEDLYEDDIISKTAQEQFYEKFYEIRELANVPLSNKISSPESFFWTGLEGASANNPTGISLSKTSFNENISTETVIAEISTIGDDGDIHSYSFGAGDNDIHNSLFAIENNQLKIIDSADFETQESYNIRITTQDDYGNTFSESFTLNVHNVNEVEQSLNNTFESSSLDEIINGSASEEIINYNGNHSDYLFQREGGSLKVSDQRDVNIDGTDYINEIEWIAFSDQVVEVAKVDQVLNYDGKYREYNFFDKGDGTYQIEKDSIYDEITGVPVIIFSGESDTSEFKSISAISDIKACFDQLTGIVDDNSNKIFRLYQSAFGRLADSDGLNYWINQYNSGVNSITNIAKSFLSSDEYSLLYGSSLSNEGFVEALYLNGLNRVYDQEGFDFWVGNLDNGIETRSEVLIGISESIESHGIFSDMTGIA